MTSATCGYCKRFSNMTFGAAVWSVKEGGGRGELSATYRCDHCRRYSVATSPLRTGDASRQATDAANGRADGDWTWYPTGTETTVYEDVPEHIGQAASEAHTCASVGAYVGAILLARTVVEATAKEKGITKGLLVTKIEALRDANLIRPAIAEAAHEIRHLGNDMAHGDLDDAPERADADDVLALMAQVLSEVYQGPAIVKRMRSRRGVPEQDPA